MNIVWSPEAIEDLASLRAYIAEDNPAAAREVLKTQNQAQLRRVYPALSGVR